MNTVSNHPHRRRSSWHNWVCVALLVIVALIAARQALAGEASSSYAGINASTLDMSAASGFSTAKPQVGLRGRHLSAAMHRDETIVELDLMLDLSLSSAFGFTNWYQTGGSFRMTGDGPLPTDHAFQIDLETARRDLEAELFGFTVYPAARIGFAIRF